MTEGVIKFPARTTDPDTDPSYQQVYYKDGILYLKNDSGNIRQLSTTPATSWTPTVTQSGSVAVTVLHAVYAVVGSMVQIQVYLLVTGSGTGGNQIIVAGIPAAAQMGTFIGFYSIGSAVIIDSGSNAYAGTVIAQSASSVTFLSPHTFDYIGNTPNFALANGDAITFTAMYEAN